jgi:Domain of unknown function (DUF4160)
VPRISSFYGITIAMYFNDHSPPHFHVTYSGQEASFRLSDLGIMEGELPPRAVRLVRQWARIHAGELLTNWVKARTGLPLDTIPGLE